MASKIPENIQNLQRLDAQGKKFMKQVGEMLALAQSEQSGSWKDTALTSMCSVLETIYQSLGSTYTTFIDQWTECASPCILEDQTQKPTSTERGVSGPFFHGSGTHPSDTDQPQPSGIKTVRHESGPSSQESGTFQEQRSQPQRRPMAVEILSGVPGPPKPTGGGRRQPQKTQTTAQKISKLKRQLKQAETKRQKEKQRKTPPVQRPRQPRTTRCNECTACQTEDCKTCVNCLDMPKFGGNGTKRKPCARRPPCLAKKKAKPAVSVKSASQAVHTITITSTGASTSTSAMET